MNFPISYPVLDAQNPQGEFCASSKNTANITNRDTPALARSHRERDPKRLMACRQLIAINGSQLGLQSGRGREAVWDRIGVGKCFDLNRLDGNDLNVADARNVASLTGAHVA